MKPFFTLRLLLSAVCFVFCSFSLFAQTPTISGPTTVCPNVTVRYTFSRSGCTNLSWGPVQNLGFTIVGQGTTGGLPYADIVFDNPVTNRTGTLNAGYTCGTSGNATLQITVRHVTDASTSTIDVPCNFTGNKEFIFQGMPAETYSDATWTTNTGWPVAVAGDVVDGQVPGLKDAKITYNVNNLNGGIITFVYGNKLCPTAIPSSHIYTITRSTSNALPAPPTPGGPSFMCTGATANMGTSPYPNATSYTWTSNAPSVKINGQTPPVTITATNGGNNVIVTSPTPASANITVQVQSSCGQSLPATGHIDIGVLPAATQIFVNGTLYTPGQTLDLQRFSDNVIQVSPINGATSYLWSLSSNLSLQFGQGTDQIDFIVNGSVGQSTSISVEGKNSCASGAGLVFNGHIIGGDELLTSTFDVYPNPANNIVIVKTGDNTKSQSVKQGKVRTTSNKHDIRQIRIYDNAGKLVNTITYSKGIQQVNIPVNQLLPGIYYLEITSDITERKKIIIQR